MTILLFPFLFVILFLFSFFYTFCIWYRSYFVGISDRIDYTPNGATVLLGEEAKLETCDATCVTRAVSTQIHLTTSHTGKGCDRDTYSIQSQRKLCGK